MGLPVRPSFFLHMPHRFFGFFAGGAAAESSVSGNLASGALELAGEASASIFTGLADGMGKTVLLLVEVDGLTFMSAIESVTFWFSESVEGRRVAEINK